MITYGSTTLTSYNSITSTKVYYYKSSSATALSGGSWSTTKPTWENGKYIWQKIRTLYEDETYTESDPVNITGQQGATGAAAYSYKLNASDTIIGKTKTGEYTVNKITFSATSKQGTSAVTAYSGRFKIETTEDGSTWTTSYTSSANESSKEFTIPENIVAVKCSLYQAGGVTVLLDIVTIPVVKDGVDAIGLKDSIPIYLASDKATGVTKLDLGWTRYRPELTAEKKYLWVYYVSRFSEGDTDPELIEIKDDVVSFENHGDVSPVENCIVDINPIQEISESEEVNPINGWNNITATRTGKNLLKLPEYEEIITYEIQASYYKIPIKLFPNTDYYLYTEYLNDYTSKGKSNCYVLMTSDPNGNSNWKAIGHSSSGIVNGTMKSTLDGYLFLKIYSGCSQEIYDELKNNCKAMLSFGTTPVTYEPYQRTDYQCSVESEENKNLVIYNKEPYLFRKSKSSQIKFLEENIVGGTVCWNQFVQNGDFSDDTNNWQVYPSSGGTFTVTNNIATFAMNQTSGAKAVMQQVNKIPVNHVVLWGCDIKTTTDNEKTHVCIYYNSSRSAASNINTRLWLASPEIGYDDTWHNRNIITRNADANAQYILVGTASGTTATNVTVEFKNVQLFDLTQMFGTEIADYILELEQSEKGAGVAWFKKYFPYSFYDYNAGEMLSVEGITQKKIIGKNLLPMNIQTGSYKYNMTISINSDKSFYVNKPNGTGWGEAEISRIFLYAGTYTLIEEDDSSQNAEIACYDENNIPVTDTRYSKIRVFDIPQNGYYTFKYWRSAAATNVLTKMSLLYGDMSLSDYLYESYYENIYPLDSSLTLKGIPKLDDNKNLYFDGDIYKSDGTVERRYGIVDLGTLTWGAYTADYGKSFYATPPSSKLRWYGITPKYAMNRVGSYTTLGDKQWTNASGAGYAMFVRDDSYTDAASFKAAMSGVYLVYELATPITEQAQPYASSQLINDWSTEEYITDSIVPVGHETNYYNNTVYGGQYNITTGELTVTYDVVDLGSLTYSVRYTGTNNKVLSTELPFNPESGLSLIAENYTIMGSVAGAAALSPPDDHDKGIYRYGSQNSKTIYIVCGVKDNPKGKLVYKIAEPKNYSLIPQEVTALTGQNYVYADSGEVTINYYDNQKSTEPYVDYATTTALEASINAFSNALGTLEAPYTEVEWVESTGKQYIYLDWKPPINTWGFEADFICRNANNSTSGAWNEETNINGFGVIFGTRNASGVNDVEFSSYQNGSLRIGNNINQATGFKTDHSRQTVKLRGNIITKADGTTSTITRLNETPDKKYSNMAVFTLYEGLRRAATGGVLYPTTTRIYSLKFYDEDTLTVDLVGAIRKRDKVTGLYDKVSKHFYPAAGMLYGEEVGDIGNIPTLTESVEKANIRTTVVNKGCSRMWEASVPLEQLEDGQKITVVYSYGDIVSSLETDRLIGWDETKSNSYVYLKLNLLNGKQTDWIPCYYSQTTRLTTHYGAGIPILLTYRENALSSATATAVGNPIMRGFFADANYNVDNNTVGVYGGTVVAGANGVKKYSLIMKDTATTWTSFTTNSGDGTAKTRYTGGLYPDKILYMGSSSDYAATKTTGTCYEALALSLRYSTNCGTTLTTSKPVYLVGELHDDGLFYLDETWWTQTVPTAENNKIYIYLGMAYSNYQIYLAIENPMYQFYNGEFILYSKVEALKNLEDLRDDLESQIDEKIQTYYQSTNPATSWTTADMRTAHDGDLWYYTGTTTSTYTKDNVYRYNGSNNTWSVYSASGELFDKVDGKSTIYYGKTTDSFTGVETGDYLIDDTDGSSYRWNGSAWVKVTDYKTAIDNLEIGGRNLYINKNDVNGYIITNGTIANQSATYKEHTSEYIPVSAGETYILQTWNEVDDLGDKTLWLGYTFYSDAEGTHITGRPAKYGEVGDKYLAYDSIVVPENAHYIRVSYRKFDNGLIKLEKGNKPTAWSPAPEDTDSSIQQLQSDLDNLEIGSRNLMLTPAVSYSPTAYSVYNIKLTEDLLADQTYTLQLWDVDVVNSATTAETIGIAVYYCGGSVGFGSWIGTNYFTDGHADHLSLTFTPTSANVNHSNVVNATYKFIRLYNSKINNTEATRNMSVGRWKLEKGNRGTDWSPAPEDVENSIKAYAESIQSQVDGMAEIHYGTAVPTLSNAPYTSWKDTATRDMHVNDLYYNTSTGYCYRFTKSGSTYSWSRIKDSDITAAATAASNANTAAGNAQTTANNANTLAGQKRRIFVNQPTPPYEVGDLWVEGSNGDIKKCKTARTTGNYTASDWELASKYTDDTLANEANDKIDNLEIGGRNLLPFKDCSSETLTRGGITLTKEEDGWIRVSGTRSETSLTTFTLWQNPDGDTYTAPINSYVPQNGNTNQFTLSVETEGTPFIMGNTYTSSTHIVAYGSTSGTSWRIGGINGTSITGVFPTYMSVIRYYIGANSTGTVNGRFRVKLERGNKATDWTPAPEDTETAISDVQDTANTALNQSVEYIVGTQTAATGSWKGVTTESELRDGKTIMYKLPFAGSGNASLQLTLSDDSLTENIPVYMIHSTSSNNGALARVTTHYPAGSVIQMTYDSNANYWKTTGYNSNINYYDRSLYAVSLAASTAIAAVRIAVLGTDGKLHILNTTAFDIKCPPLYVSTAYSTSDVTKATKRSTNYSYWGSAFALTSTHAVTGAVAGEPVYIVGTLEEDTFTPTTTVLTCTEPTSEDNLVYMRLGRMTTTANAVLEAEHPFYTYYDGAFRLLSEAEEMKAAKSATNYMSSDNTGIMVADMTDGVEKLPSDTTLTGSNVFITAGYGSGNTAVPAGVHIRDGRTDIARFGATAQIGRDDEGHVLIDSDSVDIKNGQDVLASFGESTYIGKNNGYHMLISPNDFIGISDSNAEYFKISGYVSTKTLSSNETITETTGYRTGRYFSYRLLNTPLDSSTVSVQEVFYDENYTELNARHFEQVYHYEAPSSDPDTTTWKWEENISEIPAGVGNRPQQQLTIDEELFDQENGLEIGVHLSEASVKYVVFRVTYKPANSTVAVVNPYYTFGYRKDDYNVGVYSFAEGANIIASGEHSHAEGEHTTASGQGSHAEGAVTTANGDYSHIEGYNGTANGNLSHVEGEACVANGSTSHAQGVGTIADSDAQMVLGRLNMPDSSNKYAVIVGNGDINRRSDAFRLTWDGDLLFFYQNNNPSQGTLDYDLKQAIDALNWGGDIIVG